MSDPSSFNPELIQAAISSLDDATSHLSVDGTGDVIWCQASRKWGIQPQPVDFQSKYGETLDVLHATISKACADVQAMRDNLAGIQQDADDATASSLDLASRIAASRAGVSSTSDQTNF